MAKKLQGIGCSNGIGYAKTFLLVKPKVNVEDKKHVISKKQALILLDQGIATSVKQLTKIREITLKKLGQEKAEIFDAHMQLVNDIEIIKQVKEQLNNDKVNLVKVIDTVFNNYAEMFKNMDDAYFKERATDVIDVKDRLLANILGLSIPDLLSIDQPVILACYELTPSDTALLSKQFIKGIVSEVGGRTSHAAIMARSLEIPAVLGIKNLFDSVKVNMIVGVNGKTGEVELNPDQKTWNKLASSYEKEQAELKRYAKLKTKTKDNKHVLVSANIGNPTDMTKALQYGPEGVGLYRSEFLYMSNSNWPSEEEQLAGYKAVLEQQPKNLVVIRTLDIGGDKKLAYYTFPEEMNPFLGYRAIRFCLANLDIFKTQIRALLRASVYGKLGIMFPMIATIDEFITAKEFVLKVKKELVKEGKKVAKDIQIGMMVEIPASAALSDMFAQYADFFSIGTNDLVQYTFACDRMSKTVSYLYQPNNPALLRMVDMTIKGANKHKRWVGMCGEMAGDILSIPVLLGLGLYEFSMSATAIPQARKIINSLSTVECKKLAAKALQLQKASEVDALVKKFLKDKKLI
ncbi:MAG: phosphoenolpyruvate--protein phosphotransferase [Mycoplasma sp.]